MPPEVPLFLNMSDNRRKNLNDLIFIKISHSYKQSTKYMPDESNVNRKNNEKNTTNTWKRKKN